MKAMQVLLGLLSFLVLFDVVVPANILVILPSFARSHYKPFEPFLTKLAERGHNVTVFSAFKMKESPKYNYVNVKIFEWHSDVFTKLSQMSRLENWIFLHKESQLYQSNIFIPSFLSIFEKHYNETKFDLLFTELYFCDWFLALSERFNCPLAGLSFQPLLQPYHWLLKNPVTFSYLPHAYLPYNNNMTFWQRVANTLFGGFTILFHYFLFDTKFQEEVHTLSGGKGENHPNSIELVKTLSLILVESHFTSGDVRPNLPNVVEVAGIHLPTVKQLPHDLQYYMDTAKHGVIFVSLGTLVTPEMASDLAQRLTDVFQKIPQKVIWKWKPELLNNISSNKLVREWLPQLDILNHPNCKLFISHGGYHSLVESIYSGVPMLGLPFFTDQHYNTAIIEKLGIGRKASPHASAEDLRAIITEVLANDTYRRNAQKQSLIFKDRPMSALDTAVYWTEYVLRHKGAPHLKSPATELYWFQYILLDVAVTIILASLVLWKLLAMTKKFLSRGSSFSQVKSKKLE